VPQPKVGGRGPHCWGSGVGGSVEPVDQAGRAGGLVGGSDCPLPPASLRSAAGTFPLSPAAQGDKATAAASGFLPRGAAAERGSTAGGREGARAERAGFLRFRTPSPFRLRLRGTKPGLRRAPAAVPSPTSWGTDPGRGQDFLLVAFQNVSQLPMWSSSVNSSWPQGRSATGSTMVAPASWTRS